MDTYSRTGFWVGFWPNLAQFLNREKTLTQAEFWLKANLLWTRSFLPGIFGSSPQVTNWAGSGDAKRKEDWLLLFLLPSATLSSALTIGMGRREERRRLAIGRRGNKGHPWRCEASRQPGDSRRESFVGGMIGVNLGTRKGRKGAQGNLMVLGDRGGGRVSSSPFPLLDDLGGWCCFLTLNDSRLPSQGLRKWVSWAALARLEIPITLVQGPFPTDFYTVGLLLTWSTKREIFWNLASDPGAIQLRLLVKSFPENLYTAASHSGKLNTASSWATFSNPRPLFVSQRNPMLFLYLSKLNFSEQLCDAIKYKRAVERGSTTIVSQIHLLVFWSFCSKRCQKHLIWKEFQTQSDLQRPLVVRPIYLPLCSLWFSPAFLHIWHA